MSIKSMSLTSFVLLSCALALPVTATPQLEPLWHTKDLRIPESVLLGTAAKSPTLFVSEIDGQGNAADGQGGIALLNVDGSIRQHDWLRGLNAPKGLASFQGKLYVADLTELVVIDIETAKVLEKISAPDSVFLNDVAVDPQGTVYVSDTRKNRLYRLQQNKLSPWLENVEAANGLTFVGEQLFIGAGDKLFKADAQGNLTIVAQGFAERADGVEHVGNGDFIVSCWAGLIYYVHADGKLDLLLDNRPHKLNTADIGWDSAKQILYVPTFLGNSVQAYQLKQPKG
ncbi:GTP-binding protein [Rheinheimera riviphila]|uniref:GTP-binding protein n=1 Tax=Rheinheimera riviphila TaxID=1834037 RepID=A0A437QIS1_9GAMM|nr:GTP-binding protein [Rheinheimera riviphila]RVU34344.1 GTP-binding protein [Rheinheimera riviphila]